MLDMFFKIFKAMNSEVHPAQISGGLVLGMVAGLTPLASVYNLLGLFLVLIFRVNFSTYLASLTVFSAVAYITDGLSNQLGEWLLTHQSLVDFWVSLYSIPFWKITHFNNTLTLGSFVLALILVIPVFILSFCIVQQYREHILKWVRNTRLAQILKASRFYMLYQSTKGAS